MVTYSSIPGFVRCKNCGLQFTSTGHQNHLSRCKKTLTVEDSTILEFDGLKQKWAESSTKSRH